VVSEFEKAGLARGGTDGYFQRVAFTERSIVESRSRLALVRDGKEDVLRFGDDASVSLRAELTESVEAPLVFAGYGISAADANHDDLAGLDLKGKVAVYISGAAPATVVGPVASHYQQTGVRWRALKAAGAIGIISIPNPATMDQRWERAVLSRLNPVMTLVDPRFNELAGMQVAISVNPASADRLFAGSGHTLADLLALADARKPLPRFPLTASIRARVTLESSALEAANVVGILPGSDPALAREHVVLTAHLDHVGVGSAVNGDAIYNGAMDNASGIATLIEVARILAAGNPRPRRSVVFAAVTAEEHGLLGSRYFAGDPTVPKSSIVANINMDMFLPLFPMKSVMVLGLAESDLGDRIRDVAGRGGLGVMADPQPERNRFTRSDQYSFIKEGIPALALKVGFAPGSPEAAIEAKWTEERYHRPSDDLQQPIDFGAAETFTKVVAAVATEVANYPARPQWRPGSFFQRFTNGG
jgi:Zn-dependent M28 family amino/carboxypeptidase